MELDKLKAQKDVEIGKLNTLLEDLTAKSIQMQIDLASKIDAEVMERKADNDCVTREIVVLKLTTDKWSSEKGEVPACVIDLQADVQKLASHLRDVENARRQDVRIADFWCLNANVGEGTSGGYAKAE